MWKNKDRQACSLLSIAPLWQGVNLCVEAFVVSDRNRVIEGLDKAA